MQNPTLYLDFMHDESGKGSRTKNQHKLNNVKWNQYTVQKVDFLHSPENLGKMNVIEVNY